MAPFPRAIGDCSSSRNGPWVHGDAAHPIPNRPPPHHAFHSRLGRAQETSFHLHARLASKNGLVPFGAAFFQFALHRRFLVVRFDAVGRQP
jgi:hypothetical protein